MYGLDILSKRFRKILNFFLKKTQPYYVGCGLPTGVIG